MLLNFTKLKRKYNMNISGIIHVGAHYGTEFREYLDNEVNIIVLLYYIPNELKSFNTGTGWSLLFKAL
jgi:hypothetical protein